MLMLKPLISWYSRHVPITRGKGRLQALGIRMMGLTDVRAQSRDGASFQLHFPEDRWLSHIYYCGTWETGTLEVMKRLIRPDDTVFDVGANIGWFTVHMARLLAGGCCHAFEPLPSTFRKLTANCQLNNLMGRVKLNEVALGDHDGICELYEFDKLVHGCNSLSRLGRRDYHAVEVKMITLSRYLEDHNLTRVDLIKADVEGAEMLMLSGAGRLFGITPRPIWILELNDDASRAFGHQPRDLLQLLRDRSGCEFYVVRGAWNGVQRLDSLGNYRNGDNGICVPAERAQQWREAVPIRTGR
jgi:FkbM family methyltransferase